MSIGAMKLALEALEDVQDSYGNTSEWFRKRVDALRQAIAQAEPQTNQCAETCEKAKLCAVCARGLAEQAQPVAWMWEVVINDVESCHVTQCEPPEYATKRTPLYTAPPQRQPLTDEEIEELYFDKLNCDFKAFARAIESRSGIKENT